VEVHLVLEDMEEEVLWILIGIGQEVIQETEIKWKVGKEALLVRDMEQILLEHMEDSQGLLGVRWIPAEIGRWDLKVDQEPFLQMLLVIQQEEANTTTEIGQEQEELIPVVQDPQQEPLPITMEIL
jgi:hypothetical protein